jgi:hypothetical protein
VACFPNGAKQVVAGSESGSRVVASSIARYNEPRRCTNVNGKIRWLEYIREIGLRISPLQSNYQSDESTSAVMRMRPVSVIKLKRLSIGVAKRLNSRLNPGFDSG